MLGRALALAGLVLLSSVAWAAPDERWYQLADPLFFHYGAGDGLPSGSIASIAQDERGLVWLATSGGLVRWDGRVAKPVPVKVEGADPGFREILRGPGPDLWLTTGIGLVRFDPVTEAFEAVPHERELAVLDAAFGPEPGIAWVAAEQGVARVDLATGATRLWLEEREARVFDVLLVGDEVWAGTEAGLFRKPPGAGDFELFRLGPGIPPDTRIASLIHADSGEVWVGTARRGVFVIGPDQRVSPVAIPDFHQEWVYAMVEVEPGVIWLGTFGGGIVEIRPQQGQVRRLRNNRLVPHSLAQDEIYDLYRDRDGRIWVGTRRGVSVHDPRQHAASAVYGDVERSGGIRDEAVRAVHAGSGNLIWLGLGESGVDALDPVRGRVATIAANGDDPAAALPGGAVETLVELDDGTLLVGSNWGVYEYRDGSLRRIDAQGGPGDSYVGNLLTDGETVWAGGTGGLWRLWREAGDWHAEQVPADLTDSRVTEMAMAPDGGLVVGTWDGVNWLGPDGAVRAALSGSSADSPITGSAFVTAMRHDTDDRLWMGTSGGGLYRIEDPANGLSVLRVSREDGLPGDVVRTLEFDGGGRLWVATSAGLAVMDTGTLGVHSLDTADGDIFAPYARNASTRTSAGELLFGGDGGLLVVKPEFWRAEALEPTLAVVDLRVGDGSAAGLDEGGNADDPVVVPAAANRISIEFAALDYGATRQWRYRYRLAGFENDWHLADEAHRTATYTSLPPGKYQFLVQSDNGIGGWASNEISVHVRVMPLWYQTAWGRVSIAAAILVALALAVRWWNRRMHRRQQKLEGLVRDRTSELEASGEELRKKSRELEEASTTDALTGLRNRRFLDENMKRDVAQVVRRYRDAPRRAQQAPDMLIFLVDFDAFKRVNDDYGHAAGDAVLIEMRRRLERLFRETDYLVRWGGEEFLVVARNVHRDHGEDLAERLRLMVRQEPFEIGDARCLDMTCSIGLVPFPFDPHDPDGMSWQECAEIADRCLYAAKKAGRDAWFYARPGDIGAADLSARQVRNDFWNLADSGVLRLTSNLRG